MALTDDTLLSRIATRLGAPPSYAEQGSVASILAVAASTYGAKTEEDTTSPTGFDIDVAALFEAVVESAFLVANADGEFDDTERFAFKHVVLTACHGSVAEVQVEALLADLHDQLEEDGQEQRISMIARTISKPAHAQEVLRVSALLAHVSGGVSEVELEVLNKLAAALKLGPDAVKTALDEADGALGS